MMLSDLQNKDIISIESGKNIGKIIDLNIDFKTGKIISFMLESENRFLRFKKSSNAVGEIHWENIVKIGEDIILVK